MRESAVKWRAFGNRKRLICDCTRSDENFSAHTRIYIYIYIYCEIVLIRPSTAITSHHRTQSLTSGQRVCEMEESGNSR